MTRLKHIRKVVFLYCDYADTVQFPHTIIQVQLNHRSTRRFPGKKIYAESQLNMFTVNNKGTRKTSMT